jgi:chromosomal replication initiator protein
MSKSHENVWGNCLKIIKDNVSQQSYRTWFEPIKPVALNEYVLTIQVPSQFFYEWLEEHYVTLLRKTIKRELGKEAKLEYQIVVEGGSANGRPYTVNYPNYQSGDSNNLDIDPPMVVGNSIKNPFIIPGLKKIHIDSQLNPIYNLSPS